MWLLWRETGCVCSRHLTWCPTQSICAPLAALWTYTTTQLCPGTDAHRCTFEESLRLWEGPSEAQRVEPCSTWSLGMPSCQEWVQVSADCRVEMSANHLFECPVLIAIRAAVLLSFLTRLQRFSTSSHPEALVACYAAA